MSRWPKPYDQTSTRDQVDVATRPAVDPLRSEADRPPALTDAERMFLDYLLAQVVDEWMQGP